MLIWAKLVGEVGSYPVNVCQALRGQKGARAGPQGKFMRALICDFPQSQVMWDISHQFLDFVKSQSPLGGFEPVNSALLSSSWKSGVGQVLAVTKQLEGSLGQLKAGGTEPNPTLKGAPPPPTTSAFMSPPPGKGGGGAQSVRDGPDP